jgi:hypothetical protein
LFERTNSEALVVDNFEKLPAPGIDRQDLSLCFGVPASPQPNSVSTKVQLKPITTRFIFSSRMSDKSVSKINLLVIIRFP